MGEAPARLPAKIRADLGLVPAREWRLMENIMDLKSLIVDTDPLALIALGGFVSVLVVTLGLLIFMMRKLPAKR